MESSESSVRGHSSDAVERLHEQLQESLRALVSSDDWRQALEVAARFHDYSFANTRLIWVQATARGFTPTRVAGYRAWQKLGRQVNRGEKGLQVLAPVTRKVEANDGDEERRVVGFRVVHVFDQSQTDGKSLPEVRPALLDGELPVQWERIAELIRTAGFEFAVSEADRLGEANGITDWGDRMVVVRESLPWLGKLKQSERNRFTHGPCGTGSSQELIAATEVDQDLVVGLLPKSAAVCLIEEKEGVKKELGIDAEIGIEPVVLKLAPDLKVSRELHLTRRYLPVDPRPFHCLGFQLGCGASFIHSAGVIPTCVTF